MEAFDILLCRRDWHIRPTECRPFVLDDDFGSSVREIRFNANYVCCSKLVPMLDVVDQCHFKLQGYRKYLPFRISPSYHFFQYALLDLLPYGKFRGDDE